jgi:hypothetical protein
VNRFNGFDKLIFKIIKSICNITQKVITTQVLRDITTIRQTILSVLQIWIVVATTFTLLLSSCGLFETRNAQEPETRRSTFIPPTTPDATIQNLTYSILEKNSTNYKNCLVQSGYIYIPDSKSLNQYGQIFQNWDVNSEKLYYDNLIAQTDENASSTLFLSNQVITQITSDSAVATADYIVVFQHNKNNVPTTATGNLRFNITADAENLFYIKKWEDFRKNDTDFTWSELKANFSN